MLEADNEIHKAALDIAITFGCSYERARETLVYIICGRSTKQLIDAIDAIERVVGRHLVN